MMKKAFYFFIVLIFIFQFSHKAYAEEDIPEILSESAIVMESTTGAVLYEKNAEDIMYPASLTKIATAIYTIEKGNLNDEVIVSEEASSVDGTKVYLEKDEKVTLKKLVQGMLINSGNDAAYAIAEHLHGDAANFSKHLNDYLKNEIGVENTNFTNPHGLYDKNHYTTAKDMATITNYALENKTFTDIFGTKELKWEGESWDTTLISHHQMLNGERPYEWITGGKTGYVNEAKQTLASSANNGALNLTAIVLKADYKRDIYKDTANILDYSFSNYVNKEFVPAKEYKADDRIYKSKEPNISVTVPKTGFNEEVTKDGRLLITDNEDRAVQVIKLEKEEQPQEIVSAHQAINSTADEGSTTLPIKSIMLGAGAVIILLTIVLFTFVKRRRAQQSHYGYIQRRKW
ncbi:D-alanyl-D-alanine carboxypeptidase [Cytobacillus horneckiae]|nr:D-alanyl-D-alanine carboxypeptidase [Cytobacillus horneckiae]